MRDSFLSGRELLKSNAPPYNWTFVQPAVVVEFEKNNEIMAARFFSKGEFRFSCLPRILPRFELFHSHLVATQWNALSDLVSVPVDYLQAGEKIVLSFLYGASSAKALMSKLSLSNRFN